MDDGDDQEAEHCQAGTVAQSYRVQVRGEDAQRNTRDDKYHAGHVQAPTTFQAPDAD